MADRRSVAGKLAPHASRPTNRLLLFRLSSVKLNAMAAVTGFEHLPGTTLSAGTFTITAREDADLRTAIEAPARSSEDENAHPIWCYFATQRGIDVSVAELCQLADFDVNDGPMLGTVELEYHAPVKIDTAYRVTGQVVGLERKVGRKTGTFDILKYSLALSTPTGTPVASATNTFILPRRELS